MKMTFYQLPEKDRKPLKSYEARAVRWSLAAVNSIAYAEEDLAGRLEAIPHGKVRWRLMLGQLRALCNDLLGTTPGKQCNTFRNTMTDMELRMVPKNAKRDNRVVMEARDLGLLVSLAKKDACTSCILTGEECKSCDLYRTLEAIVPLSDYGDGAICPYMLATWADDDGGDDDHAKRKA